jgi:hypothetical protein
MKTVDEAGLIRRVRRYQKFRGGHISVAKLAHDMKIRQYQAYEAAERAGMLIHKWDDLGIDKWQEMQIGKWEIEDPSLK